MLRTALAAITRRRSAPAGRGMAKRPILTRQDVQALLREELDRIAPLTC